MNRMINIILTELASDRLKYEEEMEKAINGNNPVSERVETIKSNLEKIVLTDLMVEKWRVLIQSTSDETK
jgi:hypothetical protein